ncbi:hypothetical protein [Pseudomonas sp. CCC3.1]|uniref:hypothetical protein n=1 Tax=Pseudomonas sp. CCC3.1 TaxID=3048607 RepID=UPI002AC989B4|nr:hypothetical protein [Pseudomonas sp. CCC3.1]MEB0207663.1 hypothetical protein [Pseudomonas sp. CCC3.1]WPX35725.1 hypothetical protein RHM56_20970 [Pseudomonas sp. CCC3.1]
MGGEATLNGGPAARIAASCFVSDYDILLGRPEKSLTSQQPNTTKPAEYEKRLFNQAPLRLTKGNNHRDIDRQTSERNSMWKN